MKTISTLFVENLKVVHKTIMTSDYDNYTDKRAYRQAKEAAKQQTDKSEKFVDEQRQNIENCITYFKNYSKSNRAGQEAEEDSLEEDFIEGEGENQEQQKGTITRYSKRRNTSVNKTEQ